MSNQPSTSSFSASQRDISQLKQTATDATSDLGETASIHAEKAKSQLEALASDVQSEGSEKLDEAKGQFCDVLNSLREYTVARPVACLGVALFVGLVIGLSRRSSRG